MNIQIKTEYLKEFAWFINSFSPDQVLEEFGGVICHQHLKHFVPSTELEYDLLGTEDHKMILIRDMTGTSICVSHMLSTNSNSYLDIDLGSIHIGRMTFSQEDVDQIKLYETMEKL